MGVSLGFIEEGYVHSSSANGMIQCPTCHNGLFTPKHIALSLAKEVLQWYRDYLVVTHHRDHKPLFKISRLNGRSRTLLNAIIPFISLYSIIVLTAFNEDRYQILTGSLPELSILRDTGFELAPVGTLAGDPNVARIFNVLELPASPVPVVYGQIPLSPSNPEFAHRRLWHLPIPFPVIMTTFICATEAFLTSDIEEIRLAIHIRLLLHWQFAKAGIPLAIGGGGDGHGSDGNSDGDSDGGKNEDEHNTKSTKRSFEQFNKDNLQRNRDQVGGGNYENDDFNFSEHSTSAANDEGPENWRSHGSGNLWLYAC